MDHSVSENNDNHTLYMEYQTNLNEREIQQHLTTLLKDQSHLFVFAVNEATVNAVKYGSYPVYVSVESNKDEIKVSIEDSGTGFDINKRLTEIKTKGPSQLLEERVFATSGRGLLLMYEICDDVLFNAKGTKVTLSKKIGDIHSNSKTS